LEKLEKDPNEPEPADANDNAPDAGPRGGAPPRRGPDVAANPKAPNIDGLVLKRRTKTVLGGASGGRRGARGGGAGGTGNLSVSSFTPTRDGRTLVFARRRPTGGPPTGGATIYTCTDEARTCVKSLVSTASPTTEGMKTHRAAVPSVAACGAICASRAGHCFL